MPNVPEVEVIRIISYQVKIMVLGLGVWISSPICSLNNLNKCVLTVLSLPCLGIWYSCWTSFLQMCLVFFTPVAKTIHNNES